MPERARVFVAEDDEDWQSMIGELLKQNGYSVVVTATTREKALEIAQKLSSLGVNVATVDGNLNPNDSDGYDGRAVVREIRKHAPDVKIVGFSGNREGVQGADIQGWKGDAIHLGEIVTGL